MVEEHLGEPFDVADVKRWETVRRIPQETLVPAGRGPAV
ncbi:hypothetical protein ABH928_004859 [Streptacidiphilus sp. MAP5-3]